MSLVLSAPGSRIREWFPSMRNTTTGYVFAIVVTAGVLLFQVALSSILGATSPFLFFPLAVLVVAWYGGLGPGLLASLLSGLAVAYLFIVPFSSAALDPKDIQQIFLFVSEGSLFCWFAETVHQTRDRLSCTNQTLEKELSERRRAEQALVDAYAQAERERRRLQVILEILPVGVIITDTNGHIVEHNGACRAIWGREAPLTHLEQLHLNKIRYQGDEQPVETHEWGLRRALRERMIVDEEIEIERADGLRKRVMSYAVPIRETSGNTTGGVIVHVDVTPLKQVEARLKVLNETLEQQVAERTAALNEKTEQTRALTAALILAEHGERRRISQILHDHLQQLLQGIRLQTELLGGKLSSRHTAHLIKITRLLQEAIQATRTLTVELCPPVLFEEGLGAALKWLGFQMEEVHGLEVDVENTLPYKIPNEELRILLFQLVRELLFNIVKHAGVHQASVALGEEGEDLVLRIEDQGVGFEPGKVKKGRFRQGGFGLFSIRERLDVMGGRLEIESSPGEGTRIKIAVPIEQGAYNAREAVEAFAL